MPLLILLSDFSLMTAQQYFSCTEINELRKALLLDFGPIWSEM